jgi:hypothetical protein
MNAPTRAAMIGGTDTAPNTITPSGNRLPGPGERSIQTNCPKSGRTLHLHERLGSKNANVIETKQTAGIPTEKYKSESHASFRPDASAIRIQIAAPQTAATRYNQWSLFIRSPLSVTAMRLSCGAREKNSFHNLRAPQLQARVRWRAAHGLPFVRNSAIRALTSRLTRADGSGLVSGNRIVPFEVSYPFSSAAWARLIAAVIGYRLLWCFQAAYHTSGRPSSLKAGIP